MGVITILSEDKTLIKEFDGQKDFRIALYIYIQNYAYAPCSQY